MNNMIQNQYTPNFVSPPGDTLQETLEALGMTQAELAERTGRPKKTINEIIQGKAAITPETALQLERVLGVPAAFWLRREQHYREFLARREEEDRFSKQTNWLKQVPLHQMIAFKWIKKFDDPMQQLREVLNFFGIVSPEQWQELYVNSVAYRRSLKLESDGSTVAAWLRRGEIQARYIQCAPFDETKFRQALSRFRLLTVQPPEVIEAEVRRECAFAGVVAIFVRELPGMRVCGATRWLTPTKALIQLSLRYKWEDQIWHTFFHEAGHILLHGKRDTFIDSENGIKDEEELKKLEDEADRFAANALIPRPRFQSFVAERSFDAYAVRRFAEELGISPGIVVGQLQHDGHLKYSQLNHLRRRFTWADEKEGSSG